MDTRSYMTIAQEHALRARVMNAEARAIRLERFTRDWIERVGDGRETEGWVAEFLAEARDALGIKPQGS